MEKKDVFLLAKKHWALIALIAMIFAFTAIKIPTVNMMLANRDEPLYAWQSLAIYHNPEMAFSQEIHYWYLFAVTPFLAAPLNALFTPLIAVRLIVFPFSLIALIFTFLIGKKIFSEKAGLAAAFLLMISPTFFIYATKAMPEMPTLCLATIAIYLTLTINKKRALLIPPILFIMYAIRSSAIVILPPIAIFLLIKYRKKIKAKYSILALGGLAAVIAAAFLLSPYKWMSFTAFTEFATIKSYNLLRYDTKDLLWKSIGFPIAAFALIGAIKMRKKVTLNTGLLLLWIILAALPFLLSKIFDYRYYLMAVPPLAIIAGQGLCLLFKNRKGMQKLTIAIIVLLIIIIPSITIGFSSFGNEFNPQFQVQPDSFGEWIKENMQEGDRLVILSEEYRMRLIRLSTEESLQSPRKQMIVNPSREEFERLAEGENPLYLIIQGLNYERTPWLFEGDLNKHKYLEEKGFEKYARIQPRHLICMESYSIYKKT